MPSATWETRRDHHLAFVLVDVADRRLGRGLGCGRYQSLAPEWGLQFGPHANGLGRNRRGSLCRPHRGALPVICAPQWIVDIIRNMGDPP